MINLLQSALIHVAQGTRAANCPDGSQGGGSCDTGLPAVSASATNLQSAFQIAFGIIGVLAVIMVVVGGLQFILAQGDAQTVAKARKTVLYAVIGLGVSVSAEVIVTFVVGKL